MQIYKTMADVEALAEFAHRNQTDQAGFPYINHPRRVMESVRQQGAAPYIQMAAILHDVTEDTAFTPEILIALGVPEAAVQLVSLLDRDCSANLYQDSFLAVNSDYGKDDFYYKNINDNVDARMIKLADISDNMLPWRQSYLAPERRVYLRNKYEKALRALGM